MVYLCNTVHNGCLQNTLVFRENDNKVGRFTLLKLKLIDSFCVELDEYTQVIVIGLQKRELWSLKVLTFETSVENYQPVDLYKYPIL